MVLSMKRASGRPKALPPTTRASVSFPKPVYEELEKIAEAKKVSVAWVVREAAEKYLAEKWPAIESEREETRP